MKRKTILITNDDGIQADGLIRLAEAAGRFGEVWVIAPDSQRSAASHSITLRTPIDVIPSSFPVPGVRAYACSGTPADCVRAGLLHILSDLPDVVLSGINLGFNLASDIQYSATLGAAFEASVHGVPAIALSEGLSETHPVTDHYLPGLLSDCLVSGLSPERITNINFPACPLSACRGILRNRTLSGVPLYRDHFHVLPSPVADGFRLQTWGIPTQEADDGSDYQAILDGYIAVSTLRNIHSWEEENFS